MFLQRNVASQSLVIPGSLRAVADGSAVTAGATMTVVKDGTSAAAAGTLTHVSGGAFKYAPTQAETDCKILGYVLEGTGAVTVCGSIRTTSADPNDATRLGLTALPSAAAAASGGLPTVDAGNGVKLSVGTGTGQLSLASGRGDWLSPTVAGRTLDVSATGEAGVDWANVGGPTTTVALSGTTISTGQAVASVTAPVAADVTKVGGAAIPTPAVAGVLGVDVTHVLGVAATLADGTAQAGSSTTITLAAGDPAGAGAYVDRAISIAGGTGVGQSRFVTAYSSTTKVATVHRAWDVTPDGTSQYAIGDTAAASLGPAGVDAVTVEAGLNLRQAIAILLAYVAGVKSGVTTATPTVSNPAGTATRAQPTVDADGNCSAVTLSPPA
jgi:hypothetical protein